LLVQQASVSAAAAAAAAAGQRGFTEASGGPSSQHHNQLRATWSEFGLLGRKQQQQQQWVQQQMHGTSVGFTGGTLQDGGPTDQSLLTHACTMTPSKTAAVQHSAVVSPKTAAAAADVGESLHSPFMQIQQPVADALPPSVGATQATDPSSAAAAAAGTAADGWLPTLQSCTAQVDDATATHEPGDIEQGRLAAVLLQQEQQQHPMDKPQQQLDVLVSLAAAEASVAAANAEAENDAAAAAAQAAAAEETPDTGAAGAQW
jgi:hypothetical protein